MELEQMRTQWQSMNTRMKNQELITDQLIEKMTRNQYHSKINKIGYAEYIGTIICYLGAIYLMIHFSKTNTPVIQVFTLIAILLLLVLPIISILSLGTLKNVNISSGTYLEAIEDFGKRKLKFQKLQKLNLSLGLFLLVVSVPVLSAIQGKNIHEIPYFWSLIFPISIASFLAFALWVLRSYNKILNATEKMLSDLHQ
ncbi:hypothetical protein [Gynurincola endophyticus]|uniref:hypothetical protein n=1 Tax=Gynurincola endophyticus TaxID=2479004 RepID=UPI000F8E279B|nr:hypothetical protein [Gynurincola endophyticus]